jgi:hypothetical protein
MSILNWLGIGKEISQPIEAIGTLYTTDKERIDAETKLKEVTQKPQLATIDLQKIYASSAIFFNSAYIPMLGWTCGLLILIFYAPQILICTYVWGANAIHSGTVDKFPMQSSDLLYLLGLLYGVGAHSIVKKN